MGNIFVPSENEELDLLHNAELKEAFDEFDKVFLSFHLCFLCICICVFFSYV